MKTGQKRKQQKELIGLMVQNNPKLLKKSQNIQQCKKLLGNKKSWTGLDEDLLKRIDIILFPQMAFTGYNFENNKHVLQMAVFENEGQDFQFARQIAKSYNSYVLFGYVQKVINKKKQNDIEFDLYNSAAMLDRDGRLILNTRKSHLYFCDQLWSQEGDGFKTVEITNTFGQKIKCAVGICMDINEKNFNSGKQELANFIIENKCECLLFISNWTDNSPKTNQKKQLYQMLNYWLYRLKPLLQKGQPQRLFLICDRVGFEYNYYDKKQSWFFGCSGGLNLNPPEVYEVLDKRSQTCILVHGKISQQK